MANAATKATEQLEQLKDACTRRLHADRTKKAAEQNYKIAGDQAKTLFEALDMTQMPVDDEGIQFVPTTASVVDEEAIKAYVKRYAPQHFDTVFTVPTKRVFRPDLLKQLVESGAVGRKVLDHMTTAPGVARLTIYKVK